MNINEYVSQFEQLKLKLESNEMNLPTEVLAYQFLKHSGLPQDKIDLVRVTGDCTYDSVKVQVKAMCDVHINKNLGGQGDHNIEISADESHTLYEIDEESTFYGEDEADVVDDLNEEVRVAVVIVVVEVEIQVENIHVRYVDVSFTGLMNVQTKIEPTQTMKCILNI